MLAGVVDARDATDRAAVAREVVARVAKLAPEMAPWLPLVGAVFDVELPSTPEVDALDGQFRRSRLQQVVADVLAALLPGATLLVFDDVHLLDDESGELLRRLVTDLAARAWVVLATRHEAGDEWSHSEIAPVVRLPVTPLDNAAVNKMLDAATADLPLPPHELVTLAARAEGNPLFLRELVAATQQTGTADGLPDSVEGMIAAQIDRLAPAERSQLRAAAVLGLRFERTAAEAMLGAESGRLGRGGWARLSRFVTPDGPGVLRFQHVLMRDTAYEGLSYRRRQALHARVAESLAAAARDEVETQAELLSLHYFCAGRYAEAWRFSRMAGDRAAARYANTEAAEFYRRAVDAARQLSDVSPREVAAVYESLGLTHYHLGEFAKAGVAFREARRRVRDDAVALARLRLRSAVICERAGSYGEAL
ncbi:MAG: hypothetical protein ABR520_10295, partial [Mycobacteriales bacterium]